MRSRFLSPDENNYHLYNVYILMESKTENKIPSNKAKSACQILQKEHPFLQSIIEKKDKTYQFTLLKKPPLHFFETNENPKTYIHHLMNRKIEQANLYEFHLIHCPKGDIFLTFVHHAIADGVSNHFLHQRFFELLEHLEDQKEIRSQKEYCLPLPLTQKIPLPYQKIDPKSLVKKVRPEDPNENSYSLPGNLKNHPNRIVHRLNTSLEAEQTKLFKRVCKLNGVSVNSGLCSALLMAAAKEINPSHTKFTLSHDVPVNVRPFLDPAPSNHILAAYNSCFISKVNFSSQSGFWDVAKAIQDNTQKALQRDIVYETIQASNEIYLTEKAEEVPENIFLYTSNLGVVSFTTQKYKIKSFNFHASCLVPFLATFNTYQEELNMCFIYTTPFLTKEFMDSFTKSFLEGIENELKRN